MTQNRVTKNESPLPKLRQVLLELFPTYLDLAELLDDALGENLDAVASTTNQRAAIFSLVVWLKADREARLKPFLFEAIGQRPNSAALRAIYSHFFEEESNATTAEVAPTDDLKQYLEAILSLCSYIRVPGFDSGIPLEKIWTRPSFLTQAQGAVALHQVLVDKAIAVDAPAGYGKTTLAKIIAISLARDFLHQKCPDADSWQKLYLGVNAGDAKHFPILVDLRRLQDFSEVAFLMEQATPSMGRSELESFKTLVEEGTTAVFILDGLDEVDPERRPRIFELISKVKQKWDDCYFIITSRNYEAEPLSGLGFRQVQMRMLSNGATNELVQNWAHFIAGLGKADANFISEIQRVRSVEVTAKPFVNSPLMIALLASIYSVNGRIPETNAKLFGTVADWLIKSRAEIRTRADIDLGTVKEVLGAVAYSFVRDHSSTISRAENIINQAAKLTDHSPGTIEKIIRIEASSDNCLVMLGDNLSFWHESLRDYFAASWLIRLFRMENALSEELNIALNSTEFREVGDMLIALLSVSGDEDLKTLIEKTAPSGAPSKDNVCAAALQSRILRISSSQGYEIEAKWRDRIAYRASTYLQLEDDDIRRMPIDDRVQALRAIGELHKDKRLYGRPLSRALPIASLLVDAGKYPVTVQEYNRYLRDASFGSQDHGGTSIRFPLDWENQLDTPNASVTGTDWSQATDYCAWLTKVMLAEVQPSDQRIIARLPTLGEWWSMAGAVNQQRAKDIPFLGGFCSVTRPVGTFLEQAGPYGHQDLSSGVWEWMGPSLSTKRRRKQIASSNFDDGACSPYWRRVRGSLQSPVVGFRVVFQ